MRVQVVFEHAEDVWVPVFEPTGEPRRARSPPTTRRSTTRGRCRRRGDKFEDKVAITGIGMSRVGRRLMVDPLALTVEAAAAPSPTPA